MTVSPPSRIPLPRGNEAERCYSVLEAGQILGVSKNHIYRLINRGELPVIPISPESAREKRRIRATALQAWIEAHEVVSQPRATVRSLR